MEYIIDEYIHNKVHREILKMCYLDGVSQEKIAEKVDLSPKQIYNIISKDTLIISEML
jgi:DNA-directed RNA polymerase specialized sigma24 family protein